MCGQRSEGWTANPFRNFWNFELYNFELIAIWLHKSVEKPTPTLLPQLLDAHWETWTTETGRLLRKTSLFAVFHSVTILILSHTSLITPTTRTIYIYCVSTTCFDVPHIFIRENSHAPYSKPPAVKQKLSKVTTVVTSQYLLHWQWNKQHSWYV